MGQRCGQFVVLARSGTYKNANSLWLCQCDCGAEEIKRGGYLRRGVLRACKKCVGAHISKTHITHGETPRPKAGEKRSSLYNIWNGMRSRCENRQNHDWLRYGGKGVVVAREWAEFATFRAWALANGYEPGLTIDRLDSDLNYEPANCEWVSRAENSRRVRTSYARKAVNALLRQQAGFDQHFPIEALWGAC